MRYAIAPGFRDAWLPFLIPGSVTGPTSVPLIVVSSSASMDSSITSGKMNVFYIGEKKALYASLTAGGTLTIVSGTFSLYLNDVLTVGPSAVTGFDAPGTVARAWYVLDGSALVPGGYIGVFSVVVTGADGITRTIEQPIDITVTNPAF